MNKQTNMDCGDFSMNDFTVGWMICKQNWQLTTEI